MARSEHWSEHRGGCSPTVDNPVDTVDNSDSHGDIASSRPFVLPGSPLVAPLEASFVLRAGDAPVAPLDGR